MSIAGLLVVWMGIRAYRLFNDSNYTWYLYYVAMIFVPSVYYLASRFILGMDNRIIKRFVMGFSSFLLILVLTNDLHNFVWKFYKNDNYKNYIGYFIVLIWIVLLIIASTYNLIKKQWSYRQNYAVLTLFIPLFVGLIYTFFISTGFRILFKVLICPVY